MGATTNTTNTTKTTTRVLTNTTNTTKTTTTVAKQTEWKINLVVQPDPFAKKADNDATKKAATSADSLKGINAVTGKTHGTLEAKNVAAATITQAAVKWATKPTATGGDLMITITGSVDAAAYAYCAVAKTPNARVRVLNATTTKAAVVVDIRSSATANTYNVQR